MLSFFNLRERQRERKRERDRGRVEVEKISPADISGKAIQVWLFD